MAHGSERQEDSMKTVTVYNSGGGMYKRVVHPQPNGDTNISYYISTEGDTFIQDSEAGIKAVVYKKEGMMPTEIIDARLPDEPDPAMGVF
jgi:hypothetical protein